MQKLVSFAERTFIFSTFLSILIIFSAFAVYAFSGTSVKNADDDYAFNQTHIKQSVEVEVVKPIALES